MARSVIPQVAVLLCTYNGQKYLDAQLGSIAAQSHAHWKLWVSDDGSQDNTPEILGKYIAIWPDSRVSVMHGPATGFVSNFLSIMCNVSIAADYYALSDQDDIWEPDKLRRAVKHLQQVPEKIPALYCSRTKLIDAEDSTIGFSPLFFHTPCFVHSLVQNIASGNTMVFNHAACLLVREAGSDVDVVAHDWWLYMLVSGCGGKVLYDAKPTVLYRQHDSNLVGMKSGWLGRLLRWRTLREVLQGRFRQGNERNLQALQRVRAKLTPENKMILDTFVAIRKAPLLPRLRGVMQMGLYREPLWSHLGLIAAAIFKKI